VAAESQLRRDRIKFAQEATFYKRKVLRTGAEARAVITAADLLKRDVEYSTELVLLELAVTVGADPPTPYVPARRSALFRSVSPALFTGR
jgi:hypothetical protein